MIKERWHFNIVSLDCYTMSVKYGHKWVVTFTECLQHFIVRFSRDQNAWPTFIASTKVFPACKYSWSTGWTEDLKCREKIVKSCSRIIVPETQIEKWFFAGAVSLLVQR